MVAARRFLNLSSTFRGLVAMARTGATRVQLCGRLVVKLGGRRVQTPGLWPCCLFSKRTTERVDAADHHDEPLPVGRLLADAGLRWSGLGRFGLFDGSCLNGADLSGSQAIEATFANAHLNGVDFGGSCLRGAGLSLSSSMLSSRPFAGACTDLNYDSPEGKRACKAIRCA
jgi:hypothetical protein